MADQASARPGIAERTCQDSLNESARQTGQPARSRVLTRYTVRLTSNCKHLWGVQYHNFPCPLLTPPSIPDPGIEVLECCT